MGSGEKLGVLGARADALTADVAEQLRRLAVGMRRQAADHDGGYERALQRLMRELGDGVRRRLRVGEQEITAGELRLVGDVRRRLAGYEREHGDAIARAAQHIGTAARHELAGVEQSIATVAASAQAAACRWLTETQRDVRHANALIEARDFRRRGWILATAEDGAPVPSIRGLLDAGLQPFRIVAPADPADYVVENPAPRPAPRADDDIRF